MASTPKCCFPNPPGGAFHSFGDVEYELDTIRAYNDALSDWMAISDRYLPLVAMPYFSEPNMMAREIKRAVEAATAA